MVKDIREKKKKREKSLWQWRIYLNRENLLRKLFPWSAWTVRICGSVLVSHFYLEAQCMQSRKIVTCRRCMRWTMPPPSSLPRFYMHVRVLFSQEEQLFGVQTGTTAVSHSLSCFPLVLTTSADFWGLTVSGLYPQYYHPNVEDIEAVNPWIASQEYFAVNLFPAKKMSVIFHRDSLVVSHVISLSASNT